MCGIVGYLGKGEAYPALIKGLKRLEYRGYDSAGVALISNDGALNVYKAKGKVADLEAFCSDKDISGHVGIAHTRWATHGEPSAVNAHPHYSSSKNLAMIHNGIIENYADIKKNLIAKGVEFRSETDTEVLVQLIEYIQVKKKLDLLTAVQVALRQVIGAYAIAILDKRNPNQIIAARKQSPLVVGIGKDGEFYLGSDASPIIEYTDKVVYLEDGNIAVMRLGEELQVVNIQNVKLNPEVQTVDIDLGQIEKGGFPHFMLKEIFEQPECLRNCMRGRVVSRTVETRVMTDGDDTTSKKETEMGVVLSSITDHRQQLLNAKRIIIVACGTSWHAGLIGKQMIENYCRIPVEVEYASEFRYRNPKLSQDTLVVIISQSGETADSLAALRLTKEMGVKTLAIVNVVGSSIAREADHVMYTLAGPEIAVATTKAYSTQLICMYILSMYAAQVRGEIEESTLNSMLKEIVLLPEKVASILADKERIQWFANKFASAHDVFFIGRGLDYAICQEGSLKMKEVSYVHSEAYAAGELKHGTISLIEDNTLVVGILTQSNLYEKTVSNMVEVKSRGAYLMGLTTYGNYSIEDTADFVVYIPKTDEHFEASLAVIPLQLMGYYVSVAKGLDVDKPRNLAKSVTVE